MAGRSARVSGADTALASAITDRLTADGFTPVA
jgi:hypothetical protein